MKRVLLRCALICLLGPLSCPALDITTYFQCCDGSGAVALDDQFFAVCEDEHNTLRIYRAHPAGPKEAVPVWDDNFSEFLDEGKKEEGDFEGAARIGKLIFWIGSHGTDSEGVEQPARRRLFATEIVPKDDGSFKLKAHGKPYKGLVDDLAKGKGLEKFDLGKAAKKPTKTAGGLNIEALCATPEGDLLIGFRAPIPEGKALLVPLTNPKKLIEGDAHAKLGVPILLDLDGLGFRDMVPWQEGYLIVAGAFDAAAKFALYFWSGVADAKPKKLDVDFGGLRPEGLVVYPGDSDRIQMLSDDGKQQPVDIKCKALEKEERHFQSIWLKPPNPN